MIKQINLLREEDKSMVAGIVLMMIGLTIILVNTVKGK